MADRDNTIGEPSLGKRTRQLLKEKGLKARKGLGQYFLVDNRVLGKIIGSGRLTGNDTVIEVGPGLGVLTHQLASLAGRVISVEVDPVLCQELSSNPDLGDNVSMVCADILKTSPAELLPPGATHYKVVANLPYYITAAVLRHFLEASLSPDVMVVMVQKEVARSIAARPGDMSLLSVGVQVYGRAEIVASVPARSFYPVPRVDSAVVRITARGEPLIPAEGRQQYFQIVRAGFSSPRKQLINTLSHGLKLEKGQVVEVLERAGIEPKRRAESLSVDDWKCLWQAFGQTGGNG